MPCMGDDENIDALALEVLQLRTRVRELEEAIQKHKKSMGGPGPVSRTDFILWEVLKGPTQEGNDAKNDN